MTGKTAWPQQGGRHIRRADGRLERVEGTIAPGEPGHALAPARSRPASARKPRPKTPAAPAAIEANKES